MMDQQRFEMKVAVVFTRVMMFVIPLMSDGSPAPVLELRGLFERFFDETAHGR